MDLRTIFEQPFDFDSYIENRLLSIEDLEERAFARQYLAEGLRQIMRESERSYQRLEERVYAEVPAKHDRHHIHMTVVDRAQYDITNGTWLPLLKGDEKPWTDRKMTTDAERPFSIDRVFYTGDGEGLDQIPETELLQGTVQTRTGSFPAKFQLVPAQRYLEQMERMYCLFRANGLRWTTLNCGYLLRFFDVQVVELESANSKDEILDYTVSFGDFEARLLKNRFPVWNVRELRYNSEQFVVPVIDSKHYEHSFPAEDFGTEHGYLLDVNEDILSLRHTEDDITIITAKETFQKWIAYQVIHMPAVTGRAFELPVLHNAPKDSFVARYMTSSEAGLQSKLEMQRQVEQYDLLGFLKLKNVTLIHDTVDPFDDTHMSMMNVATEESRDLSYLKLHHLNWFIQDDWVNRAEQKVLLFRFVSLKPHFLQYDLLCFVISQLQRQFYEYRCEAVLELGGNSL